jgi:hypothetical protein
MNGRRHTLHEQQSFDRLLAVPQQNWLETYHTLRCENDANVSWNIA